MLYTWTQTILTSGLIWTDPKEFNLNKYTSNSSKDVFLKLALNIQKNYENYTIIILQLQTKQKEKREILSMYQVKNDDLC